MSVAAGRVWRTVQRAPLFDADLRTLVDATARSNDRWVPTGRPGAQ
ncbi:MAG: hypothetical protein R3F49_07755 [Planctomycetota bacterium]